MLSSPTMEILKGLLNNLAQFLRENEGSISIQDYKNCYATLPSSQRIYLGKFARNLGSPQQKNGTGGSISRNALPRGEESENEETGGARNADGANNAGLVDPKTSVLWKIRRKLPRISSIEIPPTLRTVLEACKEERTDTSFFAVKTPKLPTNGGLVAAYSELRQSEKAGDILKIRRRFVLRNFYLLVIEYGYYSAKVWRRGAALTLTKEIKERYPSSGTDTEIEKTLREDVELGRGYEAWVAELGHPGYLFALPLKISETEYTCRMFRRYIPEECKRLRRLGLDQFIDELGLEQLGNSISKKLKESFRPRKQYISNKRKRVVGGNEQHSNRKRLRQEPNRGLQTTLVNNGSVDHTGDVSVVATIDVGIPTTQQQSEANISQILELEAIFGGTTPHSIAQSNPTENRPESFLCGNLGRTGQNGHHRWADSNASPITGENIIAQETSNMLPRDNIVRHSGASERTLSGDGLRAVAPFLDTTRIEIDQHFRIPLPAQESLIPENDDQSLFGSNNGLQNNQVHAYTKPLTARPNQETSVEYPLLDESLFGGTTNEWSYNFHLPYLLHQVAKDDFGRSSESTAARYATEQTSQLESDLQALFTGERVMF